MRARSNFVLLLFLAVALAGCGAEAGGETEGRPIAEGTSTAAEGSPAAGEDSPEARLPGRESAGESGGGLARGSYHFERPDHIRGIYLNAWAAGSPRRREALIELAERTEINTFVIDIKDASGYVSYRTGVPLAREIGADQEIRIADVHRLLGEFEAAGIWPIARIVVFKDPILAEARSEMAVQDSTGAAWVDGNGHVWVNPWDRRVWDYHIELAREAIELGFREIQWDYIRFPDRPASELAAAVFPGGEGKERAEAVQEFLRYTRAELEPLGAPLTGDVFGVTTSFQRDTGIGQVWEGFAGLLDAILPMVYPSHYWEGSFGFREPNANPYEIVHAALKSAIDRSDSIPDAGRIIPWLQDFTLGAPPYGVAEVRAQIQATYDVGLTEWVLWNASSRYTEGALEPVGGWPRGEAPAIRGGPAPVAAERAGVVEPESAASEAVADAGEN